MASLKDKMYYHFVEKNKNVRKEYESYVDSHLEEHKKNRLKHWWLLFRLNWHYKVLGKKEKMLVNESSKVSKPTVPKSNKTYSENLKNDRFRYIHEIWNTTGATDGLMNELKVWEQSWWCWKNDNTNVFLIYICCLLEKGDRSEAKRILDKYLANIGRKEIYKYMPVSQLYVEMGYKDFTIEKSAFVFAQLEKNRKEKSLEKLLSGKRIAVVGNGPCEIGKKRGEEIDSHDIVIRFNNFVLDGFEDDYGYKTNIWVRNGNRALKDRDNIDELDYIIWEPDYWHMHIQHDFLDIMYRDVRIAGEKIGYFCGVRKEICTTSNVLNPTAGLQLVYYLEKNKELIKELNYFGFSFLSPDNNASYAHYYNEPTKAEKDHQPKIEIEYMRRLVLNNEYSGIANTSQGLCKIYACAFREYNVKKGKTGGPGGVLAMQQALIGNVYKSCPIQYLFLPSKITYPQELLQKINSVSGKVKSVLQGAYFIQSHPDIKRDLVKNNVPVLICHDIGTAYGAFMLGVNYCVIYHQQGSILNEMIASGAEPDENELKLLRKIEQRVMENALTVYFPSNGAKNEYINTCGYDCLNVNFGEPLYNTIPDKITELDNKKIEHEFGLDKLNRSEYQIFLTIGDYNFDKGIDRIPQFLEGYSKRTSKKIYWIVAGEKQKSGIYEQLVAEKDTWSFESIILGTRISHDIILDLMEMCDFYLMLHRKSIFDLATLEAMRAGLVPILSNAGGNPEFNRSNNVVIVDMDNTEKAFKEISEVNIEQSSQKNKETFNSFFSNEQFALSYKNMIDKELDNLGLCNRVKSDINEKNLSKFKNMFNGETVVICGGGSSLYDYDPIQNAKHIALNRTVFYDKVKFDYLFMQDFPKFDTEHSFEDYNNYPCEKFYGVITIPSHKQLGFGDYSFDGYSNKIYRYELSPRLYSTTKESYEFELNKYCLADAQSVLFSALQFAVYAGFNKILLVGIDFSDTNYDLISNKSTYSSNVVDNLLMFKSSLKSYNPDIELSILKTTNDRLKVEFN